MDISTAAREKDPHACPACANKANNTPVMVYRDPISKSEFTTFLCSGCSLQFSVPMENPGAEWYKEFEDKFGFKGASTCLTGRMMRLLKKFAAGETVLQKKSLLDVGCGKGVLLAGAEKLGYRISGIDFNKDKTANFNGISATIYNVPFDEFFRSSSEKYDVVTCSQVLEHVSNPSAFLANIHSVLKTGGHAIIDVPNNNRFFGKMAAVVDNPPHHLTRWNERSLGNMLTLCGFDIVALRTAIFPLRSFYDHLFLLCSINALAFLKRASAKKYSRAESQLVPLDAVPLVSILPRKAIREQLVRGMKSLFFVAMFPTYLIVYPILAYLRNTHYGMELYAVVRKK